MSSSDFEGGLDPITAEAWIRDLENIFRALRYPDEVKLDMVIPLLRRNAEFWWNSVQGAYNPEEGGTSWKEFKRVFYEQFFPKAARIAKEEDFMTMRQKEGMTVLEYANKFHEFGHFCPQLINDPVVKARRFEQGLKPTIRSGLIPLMLEDYKDILERALRIETEIQRTDIRKEGRKKFKVEETTKPETKKDKEGVEQRRNFPCAECGRHHGGMCYKKTGACYVCGKTGH